jgi:hypothetical protein
VRRVTDRLEQRRQDVVERRPRVRASGSRQASITSASPAGRRRRRPKPDEPPEAPEGKINHSDPDSRNVKTPRGWVQGYHARAVTTADQIVIATEVTIDSPAGTRAKAVPVDWASRAGPCQARSRNATPCEIIDGVQRAPIGPTGWATIASGPRERINVNSRGCVEVSEDRLEPAADSAVPTTAGAPATRSVPTPLPSQQSLIRTPRYSPLLGAGACGSPIVRSVSSDTTTPVETRPSTSISAR